MIAGEMEANAKYSSVADERQVQKKYWTEHAMDPTLKAIFIDTNAVQIDMDERPEVLSLLPDYEGKSILELGAGIGRLTGDLAKTAAKIVTVEFVESMVKKNESVNGHFKNVSFICADVTSPELKFEDGSMDLVFSNWLLMCLSEEEVKNLAERMLRWVKIDGYIFLRESCFHSGGNLTPIETNPTHYRKPTFYTKIFKELHLEDGCNSCDLSLVTFKCMRAYIKNKQMQNQICWLWQKVKSGTSDILRLWNNVPYKSENIFGHGFVNPGGIEMTRDLVGKIDLRSGQTVLDVGCGTGGGDFYMAENFNVYVLGIDSSVDALSLALERTVGRNYSVEFEFVTFPKDYPESTFDAIYCRDALLHTQDKASVFRGFYKWLKPGGKILITDYCKGQSSLSEEFMDYIKQGGYSLHDIEAYGQILEDAGFVLLSAEDQTSKFLEVLQKDMEKVEKDKRNLARDYDFSEEDYENILNGWKEKERRILADEQKWGLFIALKQ